MLRPSVRLSTDGCEALSAMIFPEKSGFSWFPHFQKKIGFPIFFRKFRNVAENPNFQNFINFWFEYCNQTLSNARNPNLSSESPCGMTFAWKHQFPEFRLPWRCNFRSSLPDFFPDLKDLDTRIVPNLSFLLRLPAIKRHEKNLTTET